MFCCLLPGWCCFIPTLSTLANGESSIFPIVVHQAASTSICSAVTPVGSVHIYMGDNVVRMWVQLKRVYVWVLQRGNSGDGCEMFECVCCMLDWGIRTVG